MATYINNVHAAHLTILDPTLFDTFALGIRCRVRVIGLTRTFRVRSARTTMKWSPGFGGQWPHCLTAVRSRSGRIRPAWRFIDRLSACCTDSTDRTRRFFSFQTWGPFYVKNRRGTKGRRRKSRRASQDGLDARQRGASGHGATTDGG